MSLADLQLREELQPGDRNAVAAMVAASGFFNNEELNVALELIDDRMLRGEASGYRFVCGERAGHLVGYACWGAIAGTESSYDLYWIVVDPAQQRAGIGRRLLAAVEQNVAQLGGGTIWVETSSRPLYNPTRAFYARAGYTEMARLDDFYARGDAKVILAKRVAVLAEGLFG